MLNDPHYQTLLVQLSDNTIWQSSNEGFTWKRLYEHDKFLAMAVHGFNKDRAYLITGSKKVYYTTDVGKNWLTFTPPTDPNGLGIPILDFHPTQSDWLIWTGQLDCGSITSTTCRSQSHYTTDNGRNWRAIESYVKTCSWARNSRLKIDERMILCESLTDKSGSQRGNSGYSATELIAGKGFYTSKQQLFKTVVGFATFAEYLIVAEVRPPSSPSVCSSLR